MRIAMIIILFIAVPAMAQLDPVPLWLHIYGGSGDELASDLLPLDDGGYLLVGATSTGTMFDTRNAYAIRVDSSGDTTWVRQYGTPYYDEVARSVCLTQDGGFAVAGYQRIYTSSYTWHRFMLLRLNVHGDSLWQRFYGDQYSIASGAIETADGGFLVVGTTLDYSPTGVWILKTDSNGDSVWSRAYHVWNGAEGIAVFPAANGEYVICGTTRAQNNLEDFMMLRISGTGDSLWSARYGTSQADVCYGACHLPTGEFVLAGITQAIITGQQQVMLMKTSPLGDSLWARVYAGNINYEVHRVSQCPDAGFVIAAGAISPETEAHNAIMLRVNSVGDSLWAWIHGGTGYEDAVAAHETNANEYVVLGTTATNSTSSRDVLLLKAGSTNIGSPQSLVAEASGDNLILAWTRSTGPAASYRIWSDSTANGHFNDLVAETSDTSCTLNNELQTQSNIRFFTVTAHAR